MKHPLINPNSNYYDGEDGKEPTIKDFEREYTVGELMAWAKITKAKYDHPNRKGKGEEEKDIIKSKTYGDYYEFLLEIARRSPHFRDVSAERAYAVLGYELEY